VKHVHLERVPVVECHTAGAYTLTRFLHTCTKR
jgi:hypothetical protein